MLKNFGFDSTMLPAEVAARLPNQQILVFKTFKGVDWLMMKISLTSHTSIVPSTRSGSR